MRAPDEFPERLLRLGEGVDASLGATRGSKMPRMLHQCAVYISLSRTLGQPTHTNHECAQPTVLGKMLVLSNFLQQIG